MRQTFESGLKWETERNSASIGKPRVSAGCDKSHLFSPRLRKVCFLFCTFHSHLSTIICGCRWMSFCRANALVWLAKIRGNKAARPKKEVLFQSQETVSVCLIYVVATFCTTESKQSLESTNTYSSYFVWNLC